MTTNYLLQIKQAYEDLQAIEKILAGPILGTPSGEVRNLLCDANIYIECARVKLAVILNEVPK
jgi:hypothetical protein